MATKGTGVRIRVERGLCDEFLEVRHAQDRPAAQVIRGGNAEQFQNVRRPAR